MSTLTRNDLDRPDYRQTDQLAAITGSVALLTGHPVVALILGLLAMVTWRAPRIRAALDVIAGAR